MFLGRGGPRYVVATAEHLQEWKRQRSVILSSFASREKGLNLRRVTNFLHNQGFRTCPWLFLYEEDVDQLVNLVRLWDHSITSGSLIGGLASHDVLRDICYVIRRPGVHPHHDEATLVHEMIHSNGRNTREIFVPTHDESATIIPGAQCLGTYKDGVTYGSFFTEGFASYVGSVKYSLDRLGWKYGTGNSTLYQLGIDIPIHYTYLTANGLRSSYAAPAAYGLELLIGQDPQIYAVLRRCNAGRSRAHLETAVDNVGGQGLYEYLFSLRITDVLDAQAMVKISMDGLEAIRRALA